MDKFDLAVQEAQNMSDSALAEVWHVPKDNLLTFPLFRALAPDGETGYGCVAQVSAYLKDNEVDSIHPDYRDLAFEIAKDDSIPSCYNAVDVRQQIEKFRTALPRFAHWQRLAEMIRREVEITKALGAS